MDNSTCSVCMKQEPDESKLISCQSCYITSHIVCRNLSGKAASRIKSGAYFCSDVCSNHSKTMLRRQSPNTSMIASVTSELKAAMSVEMSGMRGEIKTLTTAIESSQEFLSTKFDEILRDFCLLKEENQKLKQELELLKQSQALLRNNLNKLEMNVENAHKEKNANNLVFLGVPFQPNEDVRDLTAKISSKVGVELNHDDIVSATRIGSNKSIKSLPPVKVEFKQKSVKELILRKKRELGVLLSTQVDEKLTINHKPTKIIVRNELTPFALQLLRDVRAQQENLSLKYVWVGQCGSILVKDEEGSKIEAVKSYEDLTYLIRCHRASKKTKKSDLYKTKQM